VELMWGRRFLCIINNNNHKVNKSQFDGAKTRYSTTSSKYYVNVQHL